jgi:chromosome segregation ATPase
MGKYYDSLGDFSSDVKEREELETKISELSDEDNRLYYQKDRITTVRNNLRNAIGNFDRDVEGESEQYDWLVEQLEKSRNFEDQIIQKRTEVRNQVGKLNEKLEKIREKIKGDNLVFYDREKNVSLR